MDQNQTVDNDLQKAIDDITNTTNIDPVFSDPVAAPSSVPEDDTGEIGEPIGPFPEPQLEMPTPEPTPAPTAPIDAPDFSAPDLGAPVAPPVPPEPTPAPVPESTPEPTSTPELTPEPTPAPTSAPTIEEQEIEPIPQTSDIGQIKQAALRDLIPLLDHLNLTPTQKFNIYRDTFEGLKDYAVLEPAYRAAREIPNEPERAEALLYLVESIDKM